MISIREAAKRVGVTQSAIRYYDTKGLLPHVKRDEYNNRIFQENDLIWIKLVKGLRDTDMPIEMVKQYVDLTVQGRSSLENRFQLMAEHQKELEVRLQRDQAHYITVNRWINHFIKVLDDNKLDYFPENVDEGFPDKIKSETKIKNDSTSN